MSNTARLEEQVRPRLADVPITVRVKLSALWVSAMFLYVYVDIFSFYKPGTIDDILVGRVWEFDITQAWALGALALMAIPSLMMFLSLTLPARAARWTNMVVGSLFVLVSIGSAIGETWAYYWVGSVLEAAILLLVVGYAWKWPHVNSGDVRDQHGSVLG